MTQMKLGASQVGGRLFKSAATSALALSALAGGVMLSGGDAKADPCPATIVGTMFTDTCEIVSENYVVANTTTPISPTTDFQPILPTDGKHSWVTLDVNETNGIDFTGTGIYTFMKTGGWYDKVQLRAIPPLLGAPWSVTKTVCAIALDTNGVCVGADNTLATLVVDQNTIGGMAMASLPNKYAKLYIKDVVAGNGTAHFNNDLHNVPGPLPILGAGAAFGFSRKLRGRIKASRTA